MNRFQELQHLFARTQQMRDLRNGRMTISGDQILDENGRPWVGRGFNEGHGELSNSNDAHEMAERGFNCVRIVPRFWGTWGGTILDSEDDTQTSLVAATYLVYIRSRVIEAKQAGLKVILAFDTNCGQAERVGDATCAIGTGSPQTLWTAGGATKRTQFKAVQRWYARMLRGLVDFYEPVVEPNPTTTIPTGVVDDDVKLFQTEARNEILAEDPQALFIMGPAPAYTSGRVFAWFNPAWVGNTVYTCNLLDNASSDPAGLPAKIANLTKLRSTYGAPVFVQQVGTLLSSDPTNANLANVLNLMNTASGGPIGGTVWEWISPIATAYGPYAGSQTSRTLNADRMAVLQSWAANAIPAPPPPPDYQPIAVADAISTTQNTPVSGSLASNDTPSANGGNVWSKTGSPSHGIATVSSGGNYTYTPTTGYVGSDSFTYKITDADGSISSATVSVTVAPAPPPPNHQPLAVADSFVTIMNTAVSGSLATNDDPSLDGGNVWSLTSGVSHGSVTVNADGTFTYTPTTGYVGGDSFTYTITDVDGDTSTATVTLAVTNDVPLAVADTFSTPMNATLSGSLATNDTASADGGNVWTKIGPVSHGTATVGTAGGFTYTPTTGYVGTDSFGYRITDANGDTSDAVVTITVTGSPPPPPSNVLYVRQDAAGANNGSSWDDAYTSLPPTLLRGYTYYIAKGAYGSHVFNDATSGTSRIIIQRATTAINGADPGWSGAYDGTVTFDGGSFWTDYYTIDGRTVDPNWRTGQVTGYGIRFVNSSAVGGAYVLRLDNGANVGANHLLFYGVGFYGKGRDSGAGDFLVYALGSSSTDITFSYCAFSDNGGAQFNIRGNNSSWTFDHCLATRNTSTHAVHGEFMSLTNATNFVISNSYFIDIEGSGIIAAVNGGAVNGLDFFGNVVCHTDAYRAHTGRVDDGSGITYGITGVINIAQNGGSENATGNNIRFYNNTMANVEGLWCGVHIESPGNTGNIVRNNLFYYFANTGYPLAGYGARTAITGVNTVSDNLYYQVWNEGNAAPAFTGAFVNAAALDFRLTAHSSPAGATTLGSTYSPDSFGTTRTSWDIGAFEFI